MRQVINFNNKNWELPTKVEDNRFRIVSLQNGSTVSLTRRSSQYLILEYSTDFGASWNNFTTSTPAITINAEDTVYIRGKMVNNSGRNQTNHIHLTGKCAIAGSIMHLYDYTLYNSSSNSKNVIYTYAFQDLFSNEQGLYDASDLKMDFDTITSYSCANMFHGCSAMVYGPKSLDATILDTFCYAAMFYGCGNLITTPVLKAPAADKQNCYESMFNGCSKVNNIVSYAQTLTGANCIQSWLNGVSATGDFYNLGGATYSSGASGIPSGWTEHTSL